MVDLLDEARKLEDDFFVGPASRPFDHFGYHMGNPPYPTYALTGQVLRGIIYDMRRRSDVWPS